MGVVSYDIEKNGRNLESKYVALDSAKGVRLLLSEYQALKERRYLGDTAASDVLIDLDTAITRAGLTDRQRQVLRLIYVEDLTQESAGERLGIRREAVKRHISVAETKIARVYEYWARHSEGYSITNETEETE